MALSSAVLATAMSLTGIPYRLGGADPSGFDCSGFVQYVLRQHGIGMPRTVIEQFGVGSEPTGVEAGDLVFFQTVGSKASHVGIAIDGGSFVHAPNSRGVVRVERLDAPYWMGRFVGARRVF
jgi:cell wall-associated NlpC family hydrolase